MINTKDTPAQLDGAPSRDRGLEVVRLRQLAIGVKLRHMFDEVVNEPVPDEFLEILRRADQASSAKEGQ
jgi:hypothetical protein